MFPTFVVADVAGKRPDPARRPLPCGRRDRLGPGPALALARLDNYWVTWTLHVPRWPLELDVNYSVCPTP